MAIRGSEEILYYEGEEELYLVFYFYSEEHYYVWLYIIANFLMCKQATYSIFLVKKINS